jgi:hypothetical protein
VNSEGEAQIMSRGFHPTDECADLIDENTGIDRR